MALCPSWPYVAWDNRGASVTRRSVCTSHTDWSKAQRALCSSRWACVELDRHENWVRAAVATSADR
eukprot:4685396-Pleurochrysis_carterae.AAC.1